MTGFFEEKEGVKSMSRIAMFVNILVSAFVTVYVVIKCAFTVDYLMLIFGLWFIAYGGKTAAKYVEKLPDLKK